MLSKATEKTPKLNFDEMSSDLKKRWDDFIGIIAVGYRRAQKAKIKELQESENTARECTGETPDQVEETA
jgi:hypothetical protein